METKQLNGKLFWAARDGKLEEVKQLLSKGAKSNWHHPEFADRTPLHEASRGGYLEVVKYLVSCGAELNSKTIDGRIPLHESASNGNEEIVIFLLLKGSDPKMKNTEKKTASDLAKISGFSKIGSLIEIFPRIKNCLEDPSDSNRVNQLSVAEKRVLFHVLVIVKPVEEYAHLIDQRIFQINDKDDYDGNTALHLACKYGKVLTAKKLLSVGADITIKNKEGKTCRDVADEECKKLLEDIKQLKVVIVGKPEVGKTTLVKRIFNPQLSWGEWLKSSLFGEGSRTATDGIDMSEWNPHGDKELSTIRLWDFAGQEIFYITHQFFLSENCVTLLLFNLRESLEESKLEFWLNSIQYRAPNSKVMIIGTHLDYLEETGKKAKEVIRLYSEEIHNILQNPLLRNLEIIYCNQWAVNYQIINEQISFWPVSGMTSLGIHNITAQLSKFIISTTTTKEIVQLAQKLQSMKESGKKKKTIWDLSKEVSGDKIFEPKEIPCISVEELEQMIEKFGIPDKQLARTQLHELGFILDFSKWSFQKIIYDPQWLSDLFKCVISLKTQNQLKNGQIEKKIVLSNLQNDFPKLDENTKQFLFNLLEKFEIFITHPKEEKLLVIPFLMDDEQPDEIFQDWKIFESLSQNKVGRGYLFPFLPYGIMTKIICGFHRPDLQTFVIRFWKKGILLSWTKSNILIQLLDSKDKNYQIKVQSVGENYLKSLETVEFIILEIFQREYPSLFQSMTKVIYYYQEKEFCLSFKDCMEKFQRNEDIAIENRFVIPPEKIFFVEKPQKNLDFESPSLILGLPLGKGTYGEVFRCRFQEFTGTFAIKIFKTDPANEKMNEKILNSFKMEESILKEIGQHPHLIPLLGTRKQPTLSLIFEYYDSSLKDFLRKDFSSIKEEQKIDLCYQIADGLSYLHSLSIVHLDIKSENVLIEVLTEMNSQRIIARISDFGTSVRLKYFDELLAVGVGSKDYMSPEAFACYRNSNPTPYNPLAADVYSFGCVMSDIKFGYLVRRSENELKQLNDDTAQIVLKCCQKDPSLRPISKQVRSDLAHLLNQN